MTTTDATLCEHSANAESALAALVDELISRLRAGEAIDPDQIAADHPQFSTRLRDILPGLRAVCDLTSRGADIPVCRSAAGPGGETDANNLLAGVLGEFRILREIGRGGMGIVYEAIQTSLNRRVALKVLPLAAMLDPRHLQRFKNEALAAASLDHPNIVEVHAVGCERGVHFYAMRYVEGQTLAAVIDGLKDEVRSTKDKSYLADGGTATLDCDDSSSLSRSDDVARQKGADGNGAPTEIQSGDKSPHSIDTVAAALSTLRTKRPGDFYRIVAELGIQAAEALDHAHQMGIVHRDIKPSNLMIECSNRDRSHLAPRDEAYPSPSGRGQREGTSLTTDHRPLTTPHLYITDFGLARIESDATLTMTGDLLGTLRYMSPEQAEGKSAILDHRTDIYSLGITLYELLVLCPAFPAEDRQTLLKQIANEEPSAPRTLKPAIHADFETILLKSIRKEPAERYSTARELADDLRRFLAQQPIKARRPSLLDRTRRWIGRHAALVTMAFVTLAIVAASAVTATVLTKNAYDSESEQRTEAEANLDAARRNLSEAKANLRLASQAVDNMMAQMAGGRNNPITEFRAWEIVRQATEFHEKLLAQSDDPQLKINAAISLGREAELNSMFGWPDNAVAVFYRASQLYAEVLQTDPDRSDYVSALAKNELELARLLCAIGQDSAADGPLRRSLASYESLCKKSPHDAAYQARLADVLNYLGQLHWQARRGKEAADCFDRAADICRQLPDQNAGEYETYQAHRLKGALLNNQAMAARDHNDFDGAIALLDQALAAQDRAFALNPNDPLVKDNLYRHHRDRADAYVLAHREADAAEAVERLIDVFADRPQAFLDGAKILLRGAQQCSERAIPTDDPCKAFADRYRGRARELVDQALAAPRHSTVSREHLAWFLITCAEESFRNPLRSLALAKQVVGVAPTRISAWRTLSLAHYRMGFFKEAEEALKPVLAGAADNTPDSGALLLQAMIQRQLGNNDKARRSMERATARIAHGPPDEVISRLDSEATALLKSDLPPQVRNLAVAQERDRPKDSISPLFMAVPGVPGGASALSPDGRVIAGRSEEFGAFRWTHSTVFKRLHLSGPPSGVSADGSVIVGSVDGFDGSPRVFRWTEKTGLELLGPGFAHGVSHDGSVVVFSLSGQGIQQAFRWDTTNGAVPLGRLPSTKQSWARAVSGDGRVVVGECKGDLDTRAYRWTESTGMVELGPLPDGYIGSLASCASADGSFVAGHLRLPNNSLEAARWSEVTGWVGLGDLEGGKFFSSARGISGDGRIIVGYATDVEGRKPFVWEAAQGMRSLVAILRDDYGLGESLAGLRFGPAIHISADGQTIAGECIGLNAKTAQPWVAYLGKRVVENDLTRP